MQGCNRTKSKGLDNYTYKKMAESLTEFMNEAGLKVEVFTFRH